MKKPINHLMESRTMQSSAISRSLCGILLFCLVVLASAPARAQSSGDAFTGVDQILRFMKSANYSEDDLQRRLVWTEKLVGDLVSYRVSDDDRQNYLRMLDLGIAHFQDENTRLRILLRAVTTLDPLVRKYFPQWVVQDEAMILEIMRKIRDNRDDLRDAEAVEVADRVMTGKARMRIVQSPKDPDNLIGIIIEKARKKDANNPEAAGFITSEDNTEYEDYRIVGRKNLRDVLTPDLYQKVVSRWEYAHLMETGAIKPEPYVAEAEIGIPFGGGFMWTLEADERVGEGVALQVSRIRAGFELKIGNEWVNLPFLYGPQWNALFVYEPSRTEYIKAGPAFPFTWGDESVNSDFALLKPRKLNGTWGMSGEYFKQLSSISAVAGTDADGIGAAAFVSFGLSTIGTRKITNLNGTIINGDEALDPYRSREVPPTGNETKRDADKPTSSISFYYLTATANAFYWRDLGFLLSGLRLSVGGAYQKVNHARRMYPAIDTPNRLTSSVADSVYTIAGHGTLDLFLRLGYDHHGKTTYGAAMQYFNGGLMAEVYLHIFSWMRAELKYSRLVFRDPEVWEHQEMIVPGLRIGFAF